MWKKADLDFKKDYLSLVMPLIDLHVFKTTFYFLYKKNGNIPNVS